jgi:hypothetical protein
LRLRPLIYHGQTKPCLLFQRRDLLPCTQAAVLCELMLRSCHATQAHLIHFGRTYPLGRARQPAELASIYVQLAANDASYTTGNIYGALAMRVSRDQYSRHGGADAPHPETASDMT